jgi:hypothetical protein
MVLEVKSSQASSVKETQSINCPLFGVEEKTEHYRCYQILGRQVRLDRLNHEDLTICRLESRSRLGSTRR